METISITRALTEIKHLADRISRASDHPFIGLAKGRDEKKVCVNNPQSSIVDVTQRLTSNLQSVMDLIKRRDTLKRAIIISNANTSVCINQVSMTVAEAIEQKASVEYKQQLMRNITSQYVASKNKMDAENGKLMNEINLAVTQAYGNEKGKVDEDQYSAVANPRLKMSEYSLIDPNNVEDLLRKMEDEVAGFLSEVDYVLSESNARTMITV